MGEHKLFDALMHVHQRVRKLIHLRCHSAIGQCGHASILLFLPAQVFAQRCLDDALMRHPAVSLVLDPSDVAAQSAVLLRRQPKGERVCIVLQPHRSSRRSR